MRTESYKITDSRRMGMEVGLIPVRHIQREQMVVFWVVSCSPVEAYRRFKGTSETSVNFYTVQQPG